MKVCIVIITYNLPSEVTILQIEAIRKFCQDDFEIHIIDNSTDKNMAEATRYHCGQLGIDYMKTNASSKNGSDSHAFASNLSYQRFEGKYELLMYLDHDCIPVKLFSCFELLGKHIIGGLGQGGDNPYFWPGLVLFRDDRLERGLIDFSPSPGKDTGGNLSKVIEKYGKGNCIFFNESYHENPYYKSPRYGFYSMINDEMFLHFVGGSNWINLPDNSARLNSLINVTRNLMDAN